MHIFWETIEWEGAHVDPNITCLTWVPSPQDPDEGWLGLGSQSGSVGITKTVIHPKDTKSAGHSNVERINFNLRGHHTPVR